jgi:hypothetical protein
MLRTDEHELGRIWPSAHEISEHYMRAIEKKNLEYEDINFIIPRTWAELWFDSLRQKSKLGEKDQQKIMRKLSKQKLRALVLLLTHPEHSFAYLISPLFAMTVSSVKKSDCISAGHVIFFKHYVNTSTPLVNVTIHKFHKRQWLDGEDGGDGVIMNTYVRGADVIYPDWQEEVRTWHEDAEGRKGPDCVTSGDISASMTFGSVQKVTIDINGVPAAQQPHLIETGWIPKSVIEGEKNSTKPVPGSIFFAHAEEEKETPSVTGVFLVVLAKNREGLTCLNLAGSFTNGSLDLYMEDTMKKMTYLRSDGLTRVFMPTGMTFKSVFKDCPVTYACIRKLIEKMNGGNPPKDIHAFDTGFCGVRYEDIVEGIDSLKKSVDHATWKPPKFMKAYGVRVRKVAHPSGKAKIKTKSLDIPWLYKIGEDFPMKFGFISSLVDRPGLQEYKDTKTGETKTRNHTFKDGRSNAADWEVKLSNAHSYVNNIKDVDRVLHARDWNPAGMYGKKRHELPACAVESDDGSDSSFDPAKGSDAASESISSADEGDTASEEETKEPPEKTPKEEPEADAGCLDAVASPTPRAPHSSPVTVSERQHAALCELHDCWPDVGIQDLRDFGFLL